MSQSENNKLDELLRMQHASLVQQTRLEVGLDQLQKDTAKNTKDIETLQKFKWGIIGTGAVGLLGIFRSAMGL